VTEQRYWAVLAVIADGRTVTEVAKDWLVIRGGSTYSRATLRMPCSSTRRGVGGVVGRPDECLGEEAVAFVSLKTGSKVGTTSWSTSQSRGWARASTRERYPAWTWCS